MYGIDKLIKQCHTSSNVVNYSSALLVDTESL